MKDDYQMGYEDGESSAENNLNFFLYDVLDLKDPENEESEFATIRGLVERIAELETKLLIALVGELRRIASRVGSLHSYWDLIFDIEAFLKNEPTILNLDAAGYIAEAESYLQERECTPTTQK